MSWWVEPKEEKTPMTLAEVLKKIEEHDNQYKPVDFTNCIFEEEIELRNMQIAYSLDFQYSVFKKTFSMHSSVMEGSYIELTGAELLGGVYFTALKAGGRWEHKGYALALRKATIHGRVGLAGAGPIYVLKYYENEHLGEDGEKNVKGAGRLYAAGADIRRLILKGEE